MARRWFTRSALVAVLGGVLLPVSLVVTSLPAQALAPPPPVASVGPGGAVTIRVIGRQAAAAAAPRVMASCLAGGPVCIGGAAAVAILGGGVVACELIAACKAKVEAELSKWFNDSDAPPASDGKTTLSWIVKPLDGATNHTATIRQSIRTGAGSGGDTFRLKAWCNGTMIQPDPHFGTKTFAEPSHFTYPYSDGHQFDWTYTCPASGILTGVKGLRYVGGSGTPSDYVAWGKTDTAPGQITVNGTTACKKPDGTVYNVTSSTNVVPTDTTVEAPVCQPGEIPLWTKGVDTGGTVRWDTDYRPIAADDQAHPLCAGGACGYSVVIDGEPCAAGEYPCTHWTRVAQQTPTRVQCFYGPYVVDISLCYWLERAYEDRAVPATKPNTDGNPDTSTAPSPNPTPTSSPSISTSPSASVTPKPSPTMTIQPAPPGYCASPYALGPVMPQTAALANNLGPRFNIQTVGGYRETDPYPDHPSGLAADFMVGDNFIKGGQLAIYAQQNAPGLGVDYVMWNHRIWSQSRADEGWRDVADRGSPTANHEDHVHVTMLPVSGNVPCSAAADPDPDQEGQCFPTGWASLLNPLDYVVKPLKCVFIPSPGHVNASVDGLITKVKDKGPGDLIDQIGGIGEQIDNATGCTGPTYPFSVGDFHLNVQPLNACTGTMATVAGYVKAFLTMTISIGGVLGVIRGIGTGFGWSFNFGRGGGSDVA